VDNGIYVDLTQNVRQVRIEREETPGGILGDSPEEKAVSLL